MIGTSSRVAHITFGPDLRLQALILLLQLLSCERLRVRGSHRLLGVVLLERLQIQRARWSRLSRSFTQQVFIRAKQIGIDVRILASRNITFADIRSIDHGSDQRFHVVEDK